MNSLFRHPNVWWKSLLILFMIGAYFYAKPVMLVYVARGFLEDQELQLTPRPLTDVDYDRTGGRGLSYFGFDFEVPWNEVASERESETVVSVKFAGGESVVLFSPLGSVNGLEVMEREAAREGLELSSIMGTDTVQSDFALESAILNATPEDLRFRLSRRAMVRSAILLPLKSLLGVSPQTGSGLYSFQTPWIKGFQFGAPSLDRHVSIRGFPDDDTHIELLISALPDPHRKLTQAEVNRITYTLRPIRDFGDRPQRP